MSSHIYLWEEFTVGQKLAWVFSTISNGLWLFVFIPQLYQNYKAKDSKGLSLLLLFCLIVGDIFSIISAHAKNLNPVIIYAASYHIILDVIIIAQILYYRRQSILIQTGNSGCVVEERPLLDNVLLSEDFISKYPYFQQYLIYPNLLENMTIHSNLLVQRCDLKDVVQLYFQKQNKAKIY